ncbi:hypothetical protein CN233_13495 [Sinorhizobium meliloti]|nr:hypothetical protein CDO25_31040 [Sinorhizobium meliloti]ATA96660.1 hypothetical protein BWO76_09855 [Sinorhizobium meliloti]ATB02204.1 hypothetical protein BWO90_08920 [Sinorhizobium meliloti]RVG08436.1 hypothetical protein CN234_17800 [Sinorhizobium meliloti]RVG32719.1 hypothetical protein CN233_13495 [Sinorhizobium meliloti]
MFTHPNFSVLSARGFSMLPGLGFQVRLSPSIKVMYSKSKPRHASSEGTWSKVWKVPSASAGAKGMKESRSMFRDQGA